MANIQILSAAQVIVVATEFCCKANFEDFEALQHQRGDVLGAELCCRILLTFAAASEDPRQYVPLLKRLNKGVVGDAIRETTNLSAIEVLSDEEACNRIRQMRLERLKALDITHLGEDVITRFLLQQAYRIDAETGDLPSILYLIEPFMDKAGTLRQWLTSNLLPLLRLDYEYYPEGGSGLSLVTIQDLAVMEGLDRLLRRTKTPQGRLHIGRDLRGIVGPWMHHAQSPKRRKLTSSFPPTSIASQNTNLNYEAPRWHEVNQWILKTSLQDYDLVARAILEWDGPNDIDLGGYGDPSQQVANGDYILSLEYGQAALAIVYASNDLSPEPMPNSWRILERVEDIIQTDRLRQSDANSLPDCPKQPGRITEMSPSGLALDNLLEPNHALTWPSPESIGFLRAILKSIQTLRDDLRCQKELSCRSATTLCLFAPEQVQRQELRRELQDFALIASVEANWHSVREKTLWLRRWSTEALSQAPPDEGNCKGLFWRLSVEDVEAEIFSSLLTARRYETAVALYLADNASALLPLSLVEQMVEEEILRAYDTASNGNRSRGELKRASEILRTFGPHFPSSSRVNKIEHLLAATHSLSFYSLTLQHGVPFQPVSIRVHSDPISLLGKVLEQNAKAYTKLDDLISIGRGLVAAGLPNSSTEEEDDDDDDDEEPTSLSSKDDMESKMLESDRRITYDAIISALSSNDFDTAYSYILTRLSPPVHVSTSSQLAATCPPVDDTSWRAAYAAGRHRPPISASASTSLAGRITTLSKRMELLSLALILVPDSSLLPSMLSTWRSCEDELNALRKREAAEEQAWDDRGDNISSLPGGFGLEERDVDMAETKREREKRRAAKVVSGSGVARLSQQGAPLGLLDVARGAARAIGKSAFPLRGPGGAKEGVGIGSKAEAGHPSPTTRWSDEYERSYGAGSGGGNETGHNRVRKRDMVSNMVTGGLVSGLGWVLGAEPVDKVDDDNTGLHR